MSGKGQRRRRRRANIRRRTRPGAQPGSLVVDPNARKPAISFFAYGPQTFVEGKLTDLGKIDQLLKEYPVVWVNVEGLGDMETVRRLGTIFQLHQLALEDVVNVHQRAKVDNYGQHLFIVARMVSLNAHLETEQLSVFLGRNFVLSFTEDPGDCLDPVRERLRQSAGQIRNAGPDYLAYALLDAVVDHYFPVLEQLGERLDALEDQILEHPARTRIMDLHEIKTDLLLLRRAIWPHRDSVNALARDQNPLISDETRIYIRDCYDHVVQIMDLVETYREVGSDLRDVYLSSISNRMNEVMKVLTVISTIFIPLTFITSIYGMNFDTHVSRWNMPELEWRFGYPLVWLIMLLVTAAMLVFFRRRGWIGPGTSTSLPPAEHHHGPQQRSP